MANIPNSFFSDCLTLESMTQQLHVLAEHCAITSWCLAYSGGVDSHVLLHLLAQATFKFNAVYIDHGLQVESVAWAQHCEQQCQQLGVPFKKLSVDASATQGEGPEAAARSARYSALETCVPPGTCLLTAQHLNDQSETVLLQLLRGGGAAGLAGMPEITRFAQGWHARPLLFVSQENILAYAQRHKLTWIEDPSNQHLHYDRNYLRHELLPKLQQRWPAFRSTLSVFSHQQAENVVLLDTLAELDISTCLLDEACLDINVLNEMTVARLRNALRYWLKQYYQCIPSRAVLAQIVQQIKPVSHDMAVCVSWDNVEVRRFRDQLYCVTQQAHDARQLFDWHTSEILSLNSIDKKLILKTLISDNACPYVLNAGLLPSHMQVRYRQGGEKIKPAGRNGHHSLKSLFQEAGVPGWQRNRIPLLYAGEDLVAVVGYWLASDYVIQGEGVLPVCEPSV